MEHQHEVILSQKHCLYHASTGLFAYYFSKYPHLFHGSRTSVAILRGDEQQEELDGLADDVFLYFGLGCRNVTQILLPEGYDQNNLWKAFGRYRFIQDHHKYKNNFY